MSKQKERLSVVLKLAAGILLAGQVSAQSLPDSAQDAVENDTPIILTPPDSKTEASTRSEQIRNDPVPGELVSIRDYRARIDLLESQYSAYNSKLFEAALELGVALQLEGEHPEAIEALRRALHINRVNQGLYDTGKIPVVELLIDSYIATEDWEAVESNYHTLEQLYSRNFRETDTERLPYLENLVWWHLLAYGKDLGDEPVYHVIEAKNSLIQAISIIKTNYGNNDLAQLKYFEVLVMTDFLMAISDSQMSGNRNVAFYQSAYSQGSDHIGEMLRIAQSNEKAALQLTADNLVLLADWHLIFQKTSSADETYRRAWEWASKLPDHQSYIDQIFNRPTKLPDFGVGCMSFLDEKNDTESLDTTGKATANIAVIMQFNISTTGRAEDYEVLESDPNISKKHIQKAERQIRKGRFRPRYVDGVAVVNQGVRIRYLFKPDPDLTLAEVKYEQ
jgi:tetratricopeptide (TPR) repeat protein